MHLSTVLGYIAASIGTIMAISPLLQARVMHGNHSSKDVSLMALWLYVANCIGWILYGTSIHNLTVVFPNIVALICLVFAISAAFKYRIKSPTEAGFRE